MPQFLYGQLDGAKKVGIRWPEVPDFVAGNLNPAFVLREYQAEAFGRFFHCYNAGFEGKEYPLHFLFNMATGSGKTLIMAGLMLYLYKQGHRNFLFFVHSTNIIRKTEDNFLNAQSHKYLFSDKIVFDNKEIRIRQVDNFEDANDSDINICSGLVYGNERVKTSFDNVRSIADLRISKRDMSFVMDSGGGAEVSVFDGAAPGGAMVTADSPGTMRVNEMDRHIVKNALARNDFFTFENLKHYFPRVASVNEFIKRDEYLGGLGIRMGGMRLSFMSADNGIKFEAMLCLLNELEKEMRAGITEYQGTEEFKPKKLKAVFGDKKIKVKKGSVRADAQAEDIAVKPWYAYDALYSTGEERDFVALMGRMIGDLHKNFKEIYLVRNERFMKIYNFRDGAAFEPDYLLFLVDKTGDSLTYQIFIEPKGAHLAEHDKWKEDFLEEITARFKGKKAFEFGRGAYHIRGLPFYESENENKFRDRLMQTI